MTDLSRARRALLVFLALVVAAFFAQAFTDGGTGAGKDATVVPATAPDVSAVPASIGETP